MAVLGQVYVGLSVALAAASAGYVVTGIDTDPRRIADLTVGRRVVAGVAADLAAALQVVTGLGGTLSASTANHTYGATLV